MTSDILSYFSLYLLKYTSRQGIKTELKSRENAYILKKYVHSKFDATLSSIYIFSNVILPLAYVNIVYSSNIYF